MDKRIEIRLQKFAGLFWQREKPDSGVDELRQRLTVLPADGNESQRIFEDEARRLKGLSGVKEILHFKNGSLQFVHATPDRQTAQTIEREGINCTRGGLSGVAIKLHEDPDQILQVLAGRHKGFNFVVTINLPPLPEDLQRIVTAANREGLDIKREVLLASELPEAENVSTPGYGRIYTHRLPAKFIKGYFDAYSGNFFPNRKFNPTLDSQDLKKITAKLENLDDPDAYHRFH